MNTASKTRPQIKVVAYRITTAVIVLQSAAGAYLDLTRNPDFVRAFIALGYPAYLLTILGIGRILAIIALVIPRFPRLKEWAYAGLIFDLTGAGASHLFIGDISGSVFPFLFAGVTLASWALRPADRTL